MSRLFLLILVAALALGTTTALAEEDNYDPFLGKGEHTVWDVTTSDNVTIAGFGAKYGYYSEPDDEGWFTNVWVETNQSYLMFTCTYEDGEVFMGVRFILKSLTFSEEEVVLTEEIGEHEAQEATYHRWEDEDEHHIVSRRTGSFTKSRASETLTISIGPFEFEHNIKGLFDVPAARNLVWCDDRE